MVIALGILVVSLMVATTARGVAPESAVSTPGFPEDAYATKLKTLAKTYARGRRPVLTHATFSKLNWLERTALLNVVCVQEPQERCETALKLGLSDNSLLVRDHAFRLLLLDTGLQRASRQDNMRQRQLAAHKVLEDDRNYRRGQGLWIVERARKYLKSLEE
jgi:hypothetical protein